MPKHIAIFSYKFVTNLTVFCSALTIDLFMRVVIGTVNS